MQTQLMIHTPHDWLRLFDEQNVRFVILNLRADGELVQAIRSRREWIVDFEDDETVIFASGRNKL